jgi:hypothetical protein
LSSNLSLLNSVSLSSSFFVPALPFSILSVYFLSIFQSFLSSVCLSFFSRLSFHFPYHSPFFCLP